MSELEFFKQAECSWFGHLYNAFYGKLKPYLKKVYDQHKDDPRLNDASQKYEVFKEMCKLIEDLYEKDQVMPDKVEDIKLDSDFTAMDFHKAIVHSVKKPFRISYFMETKVRTLHLYNKHKDDPDLQNNEICAVKRVSPKATLLKKLFFELKKKEL